MTGAGPVRSFDTMSIDERSLADQPRIARRAVIAAATLFGVIAALHGFWAMGITWPFGDNEALSRTVFGGPASTFRLSPAEWWGW